MIVDFFAAAAGLKAVPRRGWAHKLGIKDPESVADHSYMTGLMSMVLSDLAGLDTRKVVTMALLHDVAESRIGDLMPGEISQDEKARIENSAMDDILQDLPEPVRAAYAGIWREFQAGSTDEAAFVHGVDKLEMALQARMYSDRAPPERVGEFLESARASVRSRHLQDILEQISASWQCPNGKGTI